MFVTGTMFAMEARDDQPIPEPSWSRARRERPARTPLTREAIVDAALQVVDREGAKGLSMRRVADELGTGAASLYWHVKDKEDLLDLVFDRAIGEVDFPEPSGDWREDLKRYGHAVRKMYVTHRDIARIAMGRIPTGPNALEGMEKMLAILVGAGFQPRVIAFASDAMSLYVNAYGYEEAVPFRVAGTTDVEEGVRMMTEYFASLPSERLPHFASLAPTLGEGDRDERFEFGLDLLIRGLATFLDHAEVEDQ